MPVHSHRSIFRADKIMTKHDSDLTCTDNIITTNGCQWSYMNSLLLVCNCTLGTIASQSKTWTAYHITIRNYKRKWYFTLNSTLFRVTSESLDALLPYSLHPICKVILPFKWMSMECIRPAIMVTYCTWVELVQSEWHFCLILQAPSHVLLFIMEEG